MNLTDLTAGKTYQVFLTARLKILIHEAGTDLGCGDEDLTPQQARSLAEQLDAGQSTLAPERAHELAFEVLDLVDRAEFIAALPATEQAVLERLHFKDDDSFTYHEPERPGVIRLGLIAMHDLVAKTGQSEPVVAKAVQSLLERALLEDVSVPGSWIRLIKIPGIRR